MSRKKRFLEISARLASLALFVSVVSACSGHVGALPATVVVGTGDSFSGGGSYRSSVEQFRAQAKRTAQLLAAPDTLARLCMGAPGITGKRAAAVRKLAARALPGILSKIDVIPMRILAGPFSIKDRSGTDHAVRGRYHHPIPQVADSEWIDILQTAWESGDGFAIGAHELVHAAIDVYDYEGDGEEYPEGDGNQRKLDDFGACFHAAFEELVDSSAALVKDFGSDGFLRWRQAGDAIRLAVQKSGKTLVAYNIYAGSHVTSYVTRLLANGAIDATFGASGVVTLPGRVPDGAVGGITVKRVRVLDDDSFLVGGYETSSGITVPVLMRFDKNGTLDTAFYDNCQRFIYQAYTVMQWYIDFDVTAGGKIVAAGGGALSGRYYFTAYRFLADGRPDTTFSSGNHAAFVDLPGTSTAFPEAFVLEPSGTLLIAGSVGIPGVASTPLGLARVRADASLDPSLDGKGYTFVSFGGSGTASHAGAMAVQPDGKILLAGSVTDSQAKRAAVMRLRGDGTTDTGYGTAGQVFPLDGAASASAVRGMIAMDDGRVVIVGEATSGSSTYAAIARLRPNGTRDTSFKDQDGDSGYRLFGVAAGTADAESAVTLPSGRLLVGGLATPTVGSPETFVVQFRGGETP